ncbi:MAG: acetate--CoA ligase family protein [Candidatus Binataceae bacterium]|nr:acetate--CoA ligase family protein [Candidatus Binataceae bacterium]
MEALDEPTGKALLASFGIRVPAFRVIQDGEDMASIVRDLRSPYVLKVVSSQIVHKSDFGAVKVGLKDASQIAECMEAIRASLGSKGIRADRWLIEEMAPAGLECVVGGVIDPEFGPMVMAGIGGIFVEVMGDVAFRICPIDRVDALEMLTELRASSLFRGARGRDPVSVECIADVLLKIGGDGGVLMTCMDDMDELDVNPLIVAGNSAIAVDARFILRKRA